jgi:hypothetical protein
MCHRLNLKIRGGGVDFVANLILLESKDIDVTLEIGLVKQASGTHRRAEKFIKLTTSNRNELKYIVEHVVIAKRATNQVKLNQLDVSQGLKVPVVNKFFDVFFEELSVVPPDCDIEFVIE